MPFLVQALLRTCAFGLLDSCGEKNTLHLVPWDWAVACSMPFLAQALFRTCAFGPLDSCGAKKKMLPFSGSARYRGPPSSGTPISLPQTVTGSTELSCCLLNAISGSSSLAHVCVWTFGFVRGKKYLASLLQRKCSSIGMLLTTQETT